jgi:hypothetical protein
MYNAVVDEAKDTNLIAVALLRKWGLMLALWSTTLMLYELADYKYTLKNLVPPQLMAVLI